MFWQCQKHECYWSCAVFDGLDEDWALSKIQGATYVLKKTILKIVKEKNDV